MAEVSEQVKEKKKVKQGGYESWRTTANVGLYFTLSAITIQLLTLNKKSAESPA